eukprot:3937605-Rhodomonas_salina.1
MTWTMKQRMTAPMMTSTTTAQVFAVGSFLLARPDTMSMCRLCVHWDTELGGRQLHAIALAAACEINLFKLKKTTGCTGIVRMIKEINTVSGKEEEVVQALLLGGQVEQPGTAHSQRRAPDAERADQDVQP